MNSRQKVALGVVENIANRQIFIDGVTRSGKTMLSHVITSLEKVEHIQYNDLLEQVLVGLALDFIDAEYAKSLIRINMNMLAYNMRIGRNVNFRASDQTGIDNHKDKQLYYERLKRKDGREVVDDVRTDGRAMPYQTHNLMVNLEQLSKLEIDFFLLAVFRHPIDTIHSCWKRGWGERFGSDPISFTLTVDCGGEMMPWYAVSHAAVWESLNAMERCVKTSADLIRRSAEQYKKAKSTERIHIVAFEDFAQEPEIELRKICAFLQTETTDSTERSLREARCPRVLDLAARAQKLAEIDSMVSVELLTDLLDLAAAYEKDLYGLRT